MAVKHSDGILKIDNNEWGIRPYSTPLRVPDLEDDAIKKYTHEEGHSNAGLWRYIGEYISNNHIPSSKKKESPDYKYLVNLFKIKIKKINENNELNWLDRGLRKDSRVSTGLNGVYSSFISTFAHYAPDRFSSGGKKGTINWHKCIFTVIDCKKKELKKRIYRVSDPCTEYTITPGKLLKIRLTIEKTASKCFKLKNGNGEGPLQNVEVGMQLKESDIKKARALWIGTKIEKNKQINFDVKPAGIFEHKTFNKNSGQNHSSYVGGWRFELTKNPQIFVVSNIADKPADTKLVTFTLQIAIPSSTVN